jgi:hypothetical protein
MPAYSAPIQNEDTIHQRLFYACQTIRNAHAALKRVLSPCSDASMCVLIKVEYALIVCFELWLDKKLKNQQLSMEGGFLNVLCSL